MSLLLVERKEERFPKCAWEVRLKACGRMGDFRETEGTIGILGVSRGDEIAGMGESATKRQMKIEVG